MSAQRLRTVDTPGGPIAYVLTRKKVKNLNLRVELDGTVFLSVPVRCTDGRADDMVRAKWAWIVKARTRQLDQVPDLPPMPPREACFALLKEALDRVWPRTAPLGVAMPELKIRSMRSQWGNCHWRQGYITLNTALARCPAHLRDYVALHELVHFLHHDHGPGFYAQMDALMPDWRACRGELRDYGGALERDE